MKTLIFLLLTGLIFTSSVFAHGDEDHKKKKEAHHPDTVTVVNGDTIAVNGIPVEMIMDHHEDDDELEEAGQEETFELNIFEAMFAHVHNKIIHFPISLAVAAFLFALFGYKDKRYDTVIKILLLVAGIFGIIAFITGTLQFDAFLNDPKLWLAETHRVLGIASTVFIWLWYFSMIFKPMNKLTWAFAILTVILISATGFYGGILAH